MNPYINNVEKRAIANAQRPGSRPSALTKTQDATDKRAFGGSRQAVQAGVQNAETTRGIGDLSAKLRADAYDKGMAARRPTGAGSSQHRRQKALAESGIRAAKAAQAGLANDYFQMLSGGKMLEDKDREKLEETYKKFLEKRGWNKEQLTWLSGLLGITPVGHTEDIHKVEDATSTDHGRVEHQDQNSPNIGGLIGSGAGLIGALSDRETKTNIEKLGTDPQTELPVYAYDYKADVEGQEDGRPEARRLHGPGRREEVPEGGQEDRRQARDRLHPAAAGLADGGGLGVEALKRGIDPGDPNQWQAQTDFALDQARKSWRPWTVARQLQGEATPGIPINSVVRGDKQMSADSKPQPPRRPDGAPGPDSTPPRRSDGAPGP
jgi:hypothetical protein